MFFGAPSIAEVSFLVAVAALVLTLFRRTQSLVLQRFHLGAPSLSEGTALVELHGRSGGLEGLVLALIGFGNSTRLTVTRNEVRCESASLSGRQVQFVPLCCVSSVEAGLHRPIGWLIAAVLLVGWGILGLVLSREIIGFAMLCFIAGLFIVIYFFSKTFRIQVHPSGGPAISLRFKPGVLEGVPVGTEKMQQAVSVMRRIVLGDSYPESVANGGHHEGSFVPIGNSSAQRPVPAAPITGGAGIPELPAQSHVSTTPSHAAAAGAGGSGSVGDAEAVAKAALTRAQQYYESGRRDEALAQLREIVRLYPHTRAAAYAQKNLERLTS